MIGVAPFFSTGMQTELDLVPLYVFYGDLGHAEMTFEGVGFIGTPLETTVALGWALMTYTVFDLDLISRPVYRVAATATIDPRLDATAQVDVRPSLSAWIQVYINPNER